MSLRRQVGDALFVDLPRVRLDGGVKAFRQRWGYELQPPPTLLEEDEDGGGVSVFNGSHGDPETASISSPTGECHEAGVAASEGYRRADSRTPHRVRHEVGRCRRPRCSAYPHGATKR